MIFETLVVGDLGVNCYLLADSRTKEGVVIDPGAEPERILAAVQKNGVTVVAVLNTHGHFDHIGGNRTVAATTGAPLMIHKEDEPFLSRAATSARMYGLRADDSPLPSGHLAEGDLIRFGGHEIKVIHIPGHSPGGSCFYLEKEGILISGDSLFADSIGRTDLPGGSQAQLVNAIRSKLLTLPAETRFCRLLGVTSVPTWIQTDPVCPVCLQGAEDVRTMWGCGHILCIDCTWS